MAETPHKPTREDRLAAKLRENLHRRKAQARELDSTVDSAGDPAGDSLAPAESNGGLFKKPPSS